MRRSLSHAARFGLVVLVLAACAPAGAPASPAATGPGPAVSAPATAAPTTSAAAPASPPELVTVRVGMIPSLAGAPLLAGADLGIFERNGIQLEITPFTDTAAAMTQVVAGHLDVGHITIGSASLNAFSRGVDLTILNSGALASSPMMVRKDLVDDGSFRSVADLRGRRISINTKGGHPRVRPVQDSGVRRADLRRRGDSPAALARPGYGARQQGD